MSDSLSDQTPVSFQLGFTRPPQSDAPFLPLEVGPSPDQPGGEMAQLCKLHLQLALVRRCALRENIEDETGSIQDPAAHLAFQIALLYGGYRVIDYDQIRLQVSCLARKLRHLALPHVGRRIR